VATFAADENFATPLARLLSAAGHDIATARDLGLIGAPDDKVLLTAAEQGRVLLTHNSADFLLLHRAWLRWPAAWGLQPAPRHAGILAVPQLAADLYPWVVEVIGRIVADRPSLANELYALHGPAWRLSP
jgi:hypothetical protein